MEHRAHVKDGSGNSSCLTLDEGDEDEPGRDALLIAVALSESDIFKGLITRGDNGAGSSVRSTVPCDIECNSAGGDAAATIISAGGWARVFGTLEGVDAGSSTESVVGGSFGLD